jgi:hypothetical protein
MGAGKINFVQRSRSMMRGGFSRCGDDQGDGDLEHDGISLDRANAFASAKKLLRTLHPHVLQARHGCRER